MKQPYNPLEDFRLTQDESRRINANIDNIIQKCFTHLIDAKKASSSEYKTEIPDKAPIEAEFKNALRKQVFDMLKASGADLEVYLSVKEQLKNEDINQELKGKFDAVDKKIEGLLKSIDDTFTGIGQLADTNPTISKIPRTQTAEFKGLITIATIGLIVALSSLAVALYSNNNIHTAIGKAGSAVGGLVSAIFPVIAHTREEFYPVRYSSDTTINKAKSFNDDMKKLFSENAKTLRESLHDLAKDANIPEQQGKAPTEAEFVKYLEQRGAEVQQVER